MACCGQVVVDRLTYLYYVQLKLHNLLIILFFFYISIYFPSHEGLAQGKLKDRMAMFEPQLHCVAQVFYAATDVNKWKVFFTIRKRDMDDTVFVHVYIYVSSNRSRVGGTH